MNRKPYLLVAVCLGLWPVPLPAQTNKPAVAPPLIVQGSPAANRFEPRIESTDGKVYPRTVVKRVEPDGLLIEYALTTGGTGLAKVKFAVLPDAVRTKYGYNQAEAQAYEAEKEQRKAEYLRRLWQQEQEQKAAMAKAQAEAQRRQAEARRQAAEWEIKIRTLRAAERTANAAERQAIASEIQSLEQQRIADGVGDINWELSRQRLERRAY